MSSFLIVNEMVEIPFSLIFCTIRSTFILSVANAQKSFAAIPGISLRQKTVIFT